MLQASDSSWEGRLLRWAHEAVEGSASAEPVWVTLENRTRPLSLDRAYRFCESFTHQHSRTFSLASGLLPEPKRQAVRALYAFCRVTDDLVDTIGASLAPNEIVKLLDGWRRRALFHPPAHDDPVAQAWADARLRYRVPRRYAEQLIEGVARDLTQTRYANFDDLAAYCYGVASTVGLMSMHIIGFKSFEAIPYAVKLGVALQLTNVLRDVAEDWRNGRLYLPQDELMAFGLTEEDIQIGRVDRRWQEFMRFQIERNRQLYAEAQPGIALLDADGRFAIAAAAELYQAILNDIEAHHHNNFTRRAHVGAWGKVKRLPGIWWRSRRASKKI